MAILPDQTNAIVIVEGDHGGTARMVNHLHGCDMIVRQAHFFDGETKHAALINLGELFDGHDAVNLGNLPLPRQPLLPRGHLRLRPRPAVWKCATATWRCRCDMPRSPAARLGSTPCRARGHSPARKCDVADSRADR